MTSQIPPSDVPSLEEWRSQAKIKPVGIAAKLACNYQAFREETIEARRRLEATGAEQPLPGTKSALVGPLSAMMGGRVTYPRFQFQAEGTPFPQMTGIIEAICVVQDPERIRDGMEVAGWFIGKTGLLSGRRPIDVLPEKPDRVLKAVRQEFARWIRDKERAKPG